MKYNFKGIFLSCSIIFLFGNCGLNQSPAILGGALTPLVVSTSVKLNGAIQTSEVSLTGATTTVTLSRKVSADKSILLCSYRYGGSTLSYISNCKLSTTGDSIIFDTGGEYSGTLARYSVIEFSSGVVVSRDEIEVGVNSLGKVLDFGVQLDLTKNFIIHSSRGTSTSSVLDVARLFRASFISNQKLEFKRNFTGGGYSSKIAYQKVQIDESIVQSGELTISASTDSITKSITQVNLNKSILIFSINSDSSINGEEANYFIKGGFQNSSTIQFNRKGTTGTINISYFVIEFTGSVNVNYGSSTVSTATTKSIKTLDTSLSNNENTLLVFNNNISSGSNTSDALDSSSFTGYFSNSSGTESGNTNICFERVSSKNSSAEINYYTIEFSQK
jgi:hypothetical protein